MEVKASLFSRARSQKPATKQLRGFFALPGEIRNQVYQYCLLDDFCCEIGGRLASESVTVGRSGVQSSDNRKKRNSKLWTGDRPILWITEGFRIYSTMHDRRTRCIDSIYALMLVCKQLHMETLPLLYQSTTFLFKDPSSINHFFRVVPKQNHDNITKLQLHYTTYGNPYSTSHVIWQEKHVESWTHACRTMSKSLTSLRRLDVTVWVNEDAPKFNLRQKWLQPLLQFRRLSQNVDKASVPGHTTDQKLRTLKLVTVNLRSRLWRRHFDGNTQLKFACKDLHRLFGLGISRAILGSKEDEAMSEFNAAWDGVYKMWQYHLNLAKTGW